MCFSTKNDLLSERYCDQFDYKKLLKMIEVFISLIRTLQMELGNANSIKITPSYEMKYSDFTPPKTSSVESLLIKHYKTEEQMKECISKFTIAFNNLSVTEKEVFCKILFQNEKESTITVDNYYKSIYPKDITYIKKSAVIKFATSLKFHRMTEEVFN